MSTLLATSIVGSFARRSIVATSSSQSVTPVVTSTRKSTRSASWVATMTCRRIASSKISSEFTTHPPVSTTENSFAFHVHLPYWRSRVVPAVSLTMARRDCVSRLKSVDFPTLGRPTIATKFAIFCLISEVMRSSALLFAESVPSFYSGPGVFCLPWFVGGFRGRFTWGCTRSCRVRAATIASLCLL